MAKLNRREVKAFWDKRMPHFIERTKTQYARAPISTLTGRGIENRLFDSLISGLPKGAYLGGGFMTSVVNDDKNAKDIDIFFNGPDAFKKTVEMFLNGNELDDDLWAFKDYKLDTEDTVFKTDMSQLRFVKFTHATRPPVQLIKLVWYESAEHLIDTFDFTIAQFATDGDELVFNPISFLDLSRKRLVLHRLQFPASTLRRLIKYTQKGYYACPGSLIDITQNINDLLSKMKAGGTDFSEFEQVVYVD